MTDLTSSYGPGTVTRLLLAAAMFVGTQLKAVDPEPGGSFAPPKERQPTLQVISPTLLEVSWVSHAGQAMPVSNARGGDGLVPTFHSAAASVSSSSSPRVQVLSATNPVTVKATGVKRRALYAPLQKPNLLVEHWLYVELEKPLQPGATVQIISNGGSPWPSAGSQSLKADFTTNRLSPVIHVNQTGYLPNERKTAFLGYYLGTLGEMEISQRTFSITTLDGREVFKGELKPRPDEGFPYPSYQKVMEADFTDLKQPGAYLLAVPGLGVSYPFRVGEDTVAAIARTYALGLYHQRCGADNTLPFTRFTHAVCHAKPVSVPDTSARHENSNWTLSTENEDDEKNPRRGAPRMKSVSDCQYPFVNRGPLQVRGGHHDAGDYSKYTINSASFIHHLLTACDAFPGAVKLDNLGLPESGDGKSDLLQEAKWEADFLASMQDADGGFYFLVYPEGRRYENDVTPDRGDPQVVFPKNTAATAAALAALAQCASSPEFKRQFPESVPLYLERARKGWQFLQTAIAKYGKDGAYQRITHYGDEFMHDDELAWAAVELFLATNDPVYQKAVQEWLRPTDGDLKKWGWWRLFDAQGCAIRSYGLAVHTGRMRAEQLDSALWQECRQEILAAGDDQLARHNQSAYGTSFPAETKRAGSAGWYFSPDAAFDLAVAFQLEADLSPKRQQFKNAILGNFNYEQGANPVNVSYLTGLGWNRQFEIVHQYAQNDRRILPPSGIPLGNVQGGISWIEAYKDLPGKWSIPADEGEGPGAPYGFYDRWSDAFNLSQEFVILNQARALGVAAWLMAQTSLNSQPWKPVPGAIVGLPEKPRAGQNAKLKLVAPGLDLTEAVIIWEGSQVQPQRTRDLTWRPAKPGPAWVEAEAQLPDGRRIFAAASVTVGK